MPLSINSGTNNIQINHVLYDKDLNSFSCYENPENDPVFQVQLPFELEEMPSPEFTEKIYFFKNHLYPSKRKIPLEFKRPGTSNVVGYIFSLDDLIKSPEIFENIHMRKMAFNVILKLLSAKDISINPKISTYRQDSDYRLTDFYDEDTILVPICDQFVEFEGYDFYKYLSSFYQFGFRYCPSVSFFPNDIEVTLVNDNYQSILKRLKLSADQNNLINNYFIKTLITNEIYLKENEVARFHLLYQALEMLMEKVLKIEIHDKVCNGLNDLTGFDAKDTFRELMRDSYSLDKLIGINYSSITDKIKTELAENILQFFTYTKTPMSPEFSNLSIATKIYKVRNILFHGYSKVLSNETLNKKMTSELLKKLNDTFEYLITELISTFNK